MMEMKSASNGRSEDFFNTSSCCRPRRPSDRSDAAASQDRSSCPLIVTVGEGARLYAARVHDRRTDRPPFTFPPPDQELGNHRETTACGSLYMLQSVLLPAPDEAVEGLKGAWV
jgi:hypothetical protein